jgi:tetratricopeptide (TPR) repeat protein
MRFDLLALFHLQKKRTLVILWALFLTVNIHAFCFAQDQADDGDSGEAIALFNKGQDAHERGELIAAIELYEKALKIIPDFPEAQLQRGYAFLSLGQTDNAEKAFRHAVELRGDWTLALAWLGGVLVQNSRFAEAEPILTKAIELDDLNFPAYASMTELRLRTNAKPDVLTELLKKIKNITTKAKPTASMWAARAALENVTGDRASAKTSTAKALDLDPKNVSALVEAANIALAESDAAKAGEYVNRLSSVLPNAQSVKVLQARVKIASGDLDDAVKILDAINDPGAEATELRKTIEASRSVDSIEIEKQLAADEKNPILLSRLCSLLRTKDAVKAIDFCRRSIEAEPENLNNRIGYGAALVQAKRYDEAVASLRMLSAKAPDNATVRANLATALFQLKRFAEAKTEYRWIVDKQPNLATAYYFLAITHDQLGEYLDAMANYQQFLKIADPAANKLEIDKVNLRLPRLQKLIKDGKGKKR